MLPAVLRRFPIHFAPYRFTCFAQMSCDLGMFRRHVLPLAGIGRQAPYCAKGQWAAVTYDAAEDADFIDWLATAHSLIVGKLTRKLRVELGL